MKSLYRKYRPVRLEDVVGQEQVTEPLASALKSGKVSHAYLFVGPRGCGKTSVARILAHQINGFKYEIEDDYVDIIEIDGASNRGIDNIRELREKVAIAPTSGKYKVYIIDEVHMLTKEAFNALLKTLEEPPEHAVFIMATTDAYKVPVTITSRAQTFTFKLADSETMFKHLRMIADKEKIPIDDDALKIIVKRGGGSYRDSLSLLDQISTLSDKTITKETVIKALGLPDDEIINNLLAHYCEGNLSMISQALKDILGAGIKPETIAEEIITKIIEEPKPELFSLLGKLPEVKAPFPEAKLLVALCGTTSSLSRPGSRPSSPSPRVDGANPRAAALRNTPDQERDKVVTANNNLPQETINTAASVNASDNRKDFNWDGFVDSVNATNDAIGSQIKKCGYAVSGNELHLYPEKRITKTILSRDNNKRILVEISQGMKIVFHEPGEKPVNTKQNDKILSKISDIMGGEVKNDGGDPF